MKLLLSAMLFILVSCNGGSDGNSEKERFPQCGGAKILCMEKSDWTINSTLVNFPKNFQINLNDDFSLDSCKYPNMFTTSHSNGRMLIAFKLIFLPDTQEHLRVEIIDRGEFCDNNAIFHSEDSATFGVVVLTVDGKETRSVGVTLSN